MKFVVENAGSNDAEMVAEITKQARSGMNRDGYTAKDDEEVYFDCNILEKFDEKMH